MIDIKKELTVTEFARLGGIARANTLSDQRLQAIASNAAKARWSKTTKKQRLAASRKASEARSAKCKVRRNSRQTVLAT